MTIAIAAPLPDWVNQVLAAAQLPVAASEARREGIGNTEIRSVLDALVSSGVPASQATAIIDTVRSVHRERGNPAGLHERHRRRVPK